MPRTTSKQWLTTSQAAQALGCSPKFLIRNKDDLFKKGKHYRVLDPRAWRPTYRWHVGRIAALMGDDPA